MRRTWQDREPKNNRCIGRACLSEKNFYQGTDSLFSFCLSLSPSPFKPFRSFPSSCTPSLPLPLPSPSHHLSLVDHNKQLDQIFPRSSHALTCARAGAWREGSRHVTRARAWVQWEEGGEWETESERRGKEYRMLGGGGGERGDERRASLFSCSADNLVNGED